MNENQNAICVGVVGESFVRQGKKALVVFLHEGYAPIKLHEEICLTKPDGANLNVKIDSIELIHVRIEQFLNQTPVLIVAENLTQEDVPIGSTLWKINDV